MAESTYAQPRRAALPSFPGFDAIRLFAAWAVVYSHSYPIASGIDAADPLVSVLGGRQELGDYAVQVFFMLSGFLLSGSLDANADPLRYLTNRLARIVPGFGFAIVVSVLLIAPLRSGLGWTLLTSKAGWTSIYWSIGCLADRTGFTLSQVRFPELAGFLNGSLWSIPYELVYYLVLLGLYLLLRKDSRVAVAALVLAVVAIEGPQLGLTTIDWSAAAPGVLKLPMVMSEKTLPCFSSGVAFYAVYKRWGIPRGLVIAAAALLLVAPFIHVDDLALTFAGPVVLAALGSRRSVFSSLTEKIGDVSYGVYLFGWPVGLLVASQVGTTSPLGVFALSIPLVFVFAYAMHRLVEMPVNAILKPRVLLWLPRFSSVPAGRMERTGGPPPRMARVVHALAYGFCLVTIGRFVIYPYPFGLNWFGFQVYQLLGIYVVIALVLKAGEKLSKPGPQGPPTQSSRRLGLPRPLPPRGS